MFNSWKRHIVLVIRVVYVFVRKKRINEMSQVIYNDQAPQDIKKTLVG